MVAPALVPPSRPPFLCWMSMEDGISQVNTGLSRKKCTFYLEGLCLEVEGEFPGAANILLHA